ncbi:hypothetical protein ACWY2R_07055 [Enterococcus avium]
MVSCIYSKEELGPEVFSSGEHIIPACIGGKQKLPKDYVSHQVNQEFSALELGFARNSIISLFRITFGPGKRGSLSKKKETRSKLSFSKFGNDRKLELSYIQKGEPIVVNQYYGDGYGGKLSLNPLDDPIEKLKEFSSDKKVINMSVPDEKEYYDYYIVLDSKKLYVYTKPNVQIVLKEIFNEIEAQKQELLSSISNLENKRVSEGVLVNLDFDFKDDYFRVVAKMAFNSLAFVKGKDYVLDRCFDELREWILKGNEEQTSNFIEKDTFSFDSDRYFKLFYKSLKISEMSHSVYLLPRNEGLFAFVKLYGNPPIVVRLTNCCKEIDFNFIFLYCDWESGKLENYIKE